MWRISFLPLLISFVARSSTVSSHTVAKYPLALGAAESRDAWQQTSVAGEEQ